MKLMTAFFLVTVLCTSIKAQEILTTLNNGGHAGKSYDIVYTSTGDLITVGTDKSVRFNNISKNESQVVYLSSSYGSYDMLFSMELSPDEKWLVTGGFKSADGFCYLTFIDVETKRQIAEFRTELDIITSLAISNDGLVAAGDGKGKIFLLDVSSFQNVSKKAELNVESPIRDIVFMSSNEVAVATDNKDIKIMGMDNEGKWSHSNSASRHYLGVNALAFDSSSQLLYSGGADGFIHAFKSNGTHHRVIAKQINSVLNLDISSDGSMLAASTAIDGICRTYNLETSQLLAEFREHRNTVYSIAISNKDPLTGYSVASSGGEMGSVLIWNPYTGERRAQFGGKGSAIWDLEFVNSSELLISTNASNEFYNLSFDFGNHLLKTETGKAIKNNNAIIHGKYKIKIAGKQFENNPLEDGRILCALKDESVIYVGSDFSLKSYDLESGALLKEYVAHNGGVRSLAISRDGIYLVSGGEDQVIHLWRLNSDDEFPFQSFFVDQAGEWVCWTNQGYFNSSGLGDQYFGWLVDNGPLTEASFNVAGQYFNLLFRPEEVAESFKQGTRITDILVAKGQKAFDLAKLNRPSGIFFEQPDLVSGGTRTLLERIGSSTYASDVASTQLNVEAVDGGAGFSAIRIYQNGKLVINDNVKDEDSQQSRLRKTYEMDLLPGSNKFKAVVLNQQNVESYPALQYIEYTGEIEAVSDIYLFVIGINEYKNANYNLNYARSDASAFENSIRRSSREIFENIHVITLYDDAATKNNILSKFEEVQSKTRIQDVFVFYYAGHGTIDPDEPDNYYLVPHDITQIYGSQMLRERGVSSAELRDNLAEVSAQKQLIILDACQSGGAVQLLAMRGTPEEKAIIQLARSSGTVLLSASGSEQFAVEFDKLGHGVFTYALLEALEGKADGGSNDKKITVNEIKAYLEDRVPELSLEYADQLQFPTGFSAGQDFPIVIIPEE